ncbi:MAG: SDR family oxidoreductase [Candidatus Omnitrophica bacterium]|nr:SDR family oxidoreductase [Candidatus Omnitrophota bacterium]
MKKVVLITGCSSGFGMAGALAFARSGWRVYATMRDLSKQDRLLHQAHEEHLPLEVKRIDVTDQSTIDQSIKELTQEAGRLDVLVNNAGYGLIGPLEYLSMEQIQDLFNTNLFGAVRMIKAVLPIFRRQKSGHIINISSVAGLAGLPLYSAYCASKYALEGLSEALVFELDPFQIKISNIEPGPFDTEFSKGSVKYGSSMRNHDSPYHVLNDYFFKRHKKTQYDSPESVACLLVRIAQTSHPQLRFPIGKKVKELVLFKKFMSISLTQKVMKHLMKVPQKA